MSNALLAGSLPSAGGGQTDPEPAEGRQLPVRLAGRGGVPAHEPRGQRSPAKRSLQRRGLHRGGRRILRQKGSVLYPQTHTLTRL